jgi:phenylalanyl-tRNA synthetase alpha chain
MIIESIIENLRSELTSVEIASITELQQIKSSFLGSDGKITALFKDMKNYSDKKLAGQLINGLKTEAEAFFEKTLQDFQLAKINNKMVQEKIDVSLPVRSNKVGKMHPITTTINELKSIFSGYGFDFHDTSEIETDFFNFTALNIPELHPARGMHDTFYIRPPTLPGDFAFRQGDEIPRSGLTSMQQEGKNCAKRYLPTAAAKQGNEHRRDELTQHQRKKTEYCRGSIKTPDEKEVAHLLRTHTSTTQIHVMQSGEPPFRFISAGKTYRSDYDRTHTPMFHQMEAVCVDEGINLGNLKFIIEEFLREFFELDNIKMRMRPSYFPFTEPSYEVDIAYEQKGTNNRPPTLPGNFGDEMPRRSIEIGKGEKWMEIFGCGMIHPNVLKTCGIDVEKYSGFALGVGVERLAMLKYGISDLRDFFLNKSEWIECYGDGC